MKYEETPQYDKIVKMFEKGLDNYGYYDNSEIMKDYAWIEFYKEKMLNSVQYSRKQSKDNSFNS